MIIERYGEEDYANVIELIINLCKQYALWFSQAHEAMFVLKFQEEFNKVAPFLMNSIQDRHLRFAISA